MSIRFLDLQAMHDELRPELDRAWREVTDQAAFIGGAAVERFEADWAAYCGTRHAVGLANGTAALELALDALGVGPGDEVIVPANTFFATVSAVRTVGAVPVFVDVDPRTLLVDPARVGEALGPRTAAVIAVHLYGQPCDMDALGAICARAGVLLVEDAAQAHGATWRGRRAGSLGRIGCFSFYPGKNLGGFGDAGAVTTDDPELARAIRSLANHGRAPGSHHEHERIGANQRLDALQAAILSVKLTRLDAWNAARARVVGWYRQALADLPVELLDEAPDAVSAHHLMVVRLAGRDRVQAQLQARGIPTGIHYPIPCHRQKAFAGTDVPFLPVVEGAAPRLLSLPLHPHLSQDAVAQVADALRACLAADPVPAPPAELVCGR